MSERHEHKFQFQAQQIAEAARQQAEYHEQRLLHWSGRYRDAAERVRETVRAVVSEIEVTNGKQLNVSVDYGDPEAWQEAQLAHRKIFVHGENARRYRSDEQVYGTQPGTTYELDTDDVHHFRLGGEKGED